MPDGPRYEDDFYAWAQYQADVLRSLPIADNRFDRDHVAEEIEDLGKSERNAVRSQVRRILEHFLKLAYSPAENPRGDWRLSIANARAELDGRLSASLRHDLEAELSRLYGRARLVARTDLARYGEDVVASRFPPECPYSLDEILSDEWYPEQPEPESREQT